jgi:hypothetical protein
MSQVARYPTGQRCCRKPALLPGFSNVAGSFTIDITRFRPTRLEVTSMPDEPAQ